MQLLRIEGVNLAHSIDDTEDLSTRRGGSLMLLEVINEIETQCSKDLKRISTGASAGLFEVTGNADIAKSVIRSLLHQEPYRYGTFAVETVQANDGFPMLERATLAANRWQQMQSLSFSPMGLKGGNDQVCTVDEVRPASQEATVKGTQGQAISASVKARRDHGVTAKRQFYNRTLDNRYANLKFTSDFEAIATDPRVKLDPKTLDGKLAVFYADGNSFGGIARSCETPAALTAWDNYIKGQRKAMLSALLERASRQNRWQTKANALRLETLLWGGDELMFAVPGWCGLELAQLFFERTKDMRYPENGQGKPLTHACGLVLCHHQAPISRIAHLAKALAEKGKETNREANSLNWLVLESFDHTGAGLDDYLKRRFGPSLGWSDLALNGISLPILAENFSKLRKELPRSAIVRITRALAERRASDAQGEVMPLIRRARQQVAEAGGDAFKALWPKLHPKAAPWDDATASADDLGAWLKLAELWDYCPDWSNGDQQEAQP